MKGEGLRPNRSSPWGGSHLSRTPSQALNLSAGHGGVHQSSRDLVGLLQALGPSHIVRQARKLRAEPEVPAVPLLPGKGPDNAGVGVQQAASDSCL